MWTNLLDAADRTDFKVNDIKGAYQEMTQTMVEDFKKELKRAYEEYIENGPGAEHIDLHDGLRLLEDSRQLCISFSARKDGMVLSENLFGLPIS